MTDVPNVARTADDDAHGRLGDTLQGAAAEFGVALAAADRRSPSGPEVVLSPALRGAVAGLSRALVGRAKADPGGLEALLGESFGAKAKGPAGRILVARMAAGDVPMPASLRVVGDETLPPGARGAYDARNGGTISLHRDLLRDPAQLERVLAEETGHHLDRVLGGGDAAGDEGAVFARRLGGERLGAGALAALRAEDDRGTLRDGRTAEFDSSVAQATTTEPAVGDTGSGDAAQDVSNLTNVDDATKPIVAPQNRIVVGVSTRGSVLVEAVDEVLEEAIQKAVESAPYFKNVTRKGEWLATVVNDVKGSDAYQAIRKRLLAGAREFDEEFADLFKTPGIAGSGERPPLDATAFDPLDLIGFELWIPPLNPEAVSVFNDGEGNIATDVGDWFKKALSNGFANVKVFTDGLARIPGVDGDGTALVTNILNIGAQVFGAKLAGVETGDVVENFIMGGGTLLSGPDVTKGNNFQVGMPLGAIGQDGFFVPTDEIWLTSLTYNVPVGTDPDARFYLGYADLRRTILTRNDQGEWDFTGFQVADRAIELGFRFAPGDKTTGDLNAHVGTIGRFSAYFDKQAIVDGSVRQLPDGTLGHYSQEGGVAKFRPFDEQDEAIFTNVFLARQDGVTIDDVKLLTLAEDFQTVTDADLEVADELGPVARWVVENGNRPEVQDAWSAGVTLIPALLTGDPVAIGFASANAFVDVTENQFNRTYDDIVTSYTIETPEGGEDFSANAFVGTEFLGIAKDLERVDRLHAQYTGLPGKSDTTLQEFLNDEGATGVVGTTPTNEENALVAEAQGIVGGMELRVEGLQGVTNRLLIEGHATAAELHGALAPYLDAPGSPDAVSSPKGMDGLFSSLADRLLGGSDPLTLFSGDGRSTSTDWVENIGANLATIAVDTSRPVALQILRETDGLTDLAEFEFASLGEIEDATSTAEISNLLLERGVDPFQLYAELEAVLVEGNARLGRYDRRALDVVVDGVPGLAAPRQLAENLTDGVREAFRLSEWRSTGTVDVNDITYEEALAFLSENSGVNLDPSVDGWSQTLDVFEGLLTRKYPDFLSNPGRFFVTSAEEGRRIFARFVDDLALDLLANGAGNLSDGGGNEALAASLAEYRAIVDSDVPPDRLQQEFGLTEDQAAGIVAARQYEAKRDPIDVQQYFDTDSPRSSDGRDPGARALGDAAFAAVAADIDARFGIVASAHDAGIGGARVGSDAPVPREDLPAQDNLVLREIVGEELTGFAARQQGAGPGSLDRKVVAEDNIRAYVESIPDLSAADKDALHQELFVDPQNGLWVLAPQSQLEGAVANYAQTRGELEADGTDTASEIDAISSTRFDLEVANERSEAFAGGYSNDAYRDARWSTTTPEARGDLDRGAYEAGFQSEYAGITSDIVAAQSGDADARSRLDARGIDPFSPTADDAAARQAGDLALTPAANARVAAALAGVPAGAGAAAVEAAVAGALAEPAEVEAPDLEALRADTRAQIDLLTGLPGNEAAVAFLRSFDLILGTIEATGAEFTGSAIGEFLSGTSPSLGFFLGRVGAGDAAAWSALSSDLGSFASALDDGRREAFAESAYGFTVAGGVLVLAGSGEVPDDALIVSGELLTIAGEGMLAAAGKPVPGFGEGVPVTPELAVGAGFGRLLNRYADGTGTELDDLAGILLQEGLPAWATINAPDVFAPIEVGPGGKLTGGGLLIDNDLMGASMAVGAAGSVLGELIDGRVGEILEGLSDGASTGLALAAGGINPAQAVIGVTTALFDTVGVEIPPQAQMGALIATAAVNASNPVGWAALAVQVGVQLLGMKEWTTVTDIAPGIDADGDFQFDDTGQVSTDFHTDFWGSAKVDGGRLQYPVPSPNPQLLESATFDLATGAERPVSFEPAREIEHGTSDGAWTSREPDRIVIDGRAIAGELQVPSPRALADAEVGETVVAQFVPDAKATSGHVREIDELVAKGILPEGVESIPVRVTRDRAPEGGLRSRYEWAGDRAATEAEAFSYEVDPAWRDETLAPGLRIEGAYGGLNPATAGETFARTAVLTREQFDRLSAELGSLEPVTMAGDDPRLLRIDDPATAGVDEGAPSALSEVMEGVTVTFDSAEGAADLYQVHGRDGRRPSRPRALRHRAGRRRAGHGRRDVRGHDPGPRPRGAGPAHDQGPHDRGGGRGRHAGALPLRLGRGAPRDRARRARSGVDLPCRRRGGPARRAEGAARHRHPPAVRHGRRGRAAPEPRRRHRRGLGRLRRLPADQRGRRRAPRGARGRARPLRRAGLRRGQPRAGRGAGRGRRHAARRPLPDPRQRRGPRDRRRGHRAGGRSRPGLAGPALNRHRAARRRADAQGRDAVVAERALRRGVRPRRPGGGAGRLRPLVGHADPGLGGPALGQRRRRLGGDAGRRQPGDPRRRRRGGVRLGHLLRDRARARPLRAHAGRRRHAERAGRGGGRRALARRTGGERRRRARPGDPPRGTRRGRAGARALAGGPRSGPSNHER